MRYVLGGRGRLGRAIADARPAGEVVVLDRAIYEDWWQSGADARVSRYFESAPVGSVVLVAAGVLDPAEPEQAHRRINVDLPANVIDGVRALGRGPGLRVVTFGTVMERLSAHPNAYIQSKAELGRFVAERAAEGADVAHAQVHTLYGVGLPSTHMFLGQMLSALKAARPFEMTPGRQLREYHHVDDDVAAIDAMLAAEIRGVVALSHGAPCTLCDIATHVFERLGRVGDLRIGARPEPADDNYATVLPRPTWLDAVSFRATLPAVADYMQSQFLKPQPE